MDRKLIPSAVLILSLMGCQPQNQNLAQVCDPTLASCSEQLNKDKGPLFIAPIEVDQVDLQHRIAELRRWLNWQRAVALGETDQPYEVEEPLISASPELKLQRTIAVEDRIQAVQLLADSSDMIEATLLSREMLTLEPNSVDLILLHSSLLTRQERYAESRALLASALARFPEVAELYNNQAANAAAEGELGEAIELLQTAFSTHPSFAQIQSNLKSLYTLTAQRALSPQETPDRPELKVLETRYYSVPHSPLEPLIAKE